MLTATSTRARGLPGSVGDGVAGGGRVARIAVPAAVALAVTVLAVSQMRAVPFYITSDSGHLLADADAVVGNGVRDLRHAPLLPAVFAVLGLFLSDGAVVEVGMVTVLVAIVFAAHALLSRLVESAAGVFAGVALIGFAPVYSEAVGWYGAVMLLGIALAVWASALIDDALAHADRRKVIGAGVVTGLVGLTHPFALVFMAQVGFLVLVVSVVGGVMKGSLRRSAAWRTAKVSAAVIGVAAVVMIPALPFYLDVERPLAVAPDLSRLGLVFDWAFRESPVLWAGALLVAVTALSMGAVAGPVERRRLHIWMAGFGVVAVANVLVFAGHDSYATRNLYFLPVAAGAGVAVAVGAGVSRTGLVPRWVGAAAAVGLVMAAGVLVRDLDERLGVAVPYYNTLSAEEHEAIHELRGRAVAVAVTPRGAEAVSGTLYAWMIEGLADVRAIGTGDRYLSLLTRAWEDTLDVQRILAGTHVAEAGGLRVAADIAAPDRIAIQGSLGDDWRSVLQVDVRGEAAADAQWLLRTGAERDRASIFQDGVSSIRRTFTVHPTGGGLQPGSGRLEVVLDGGTDERLTIRPIGRVVDAQNLGTSVVVAQVVFGRDVVLEVATGPGASMSLDTSTGVVHITPVSPATGTLLATVEVVGVDHVDQPPETVETVDVIAEHGLSHVFTWKGTAVAGRLTARPCFDTEWENDDVLLLAVTAQCRPGGP